MSDFIKCRKDCGACCISISISSALPNHPNGKSAGVRCQNLDKNNVCSIWNSSEFPKICGTFKAETMICGNNFDEATRIIENIEKSFNENEL